MLESSGKCLVSWTTMDLDNARAIWQVSGLVDDYVYVNQRNCACLPDETTSKLVTEVGCVVVSINGMDPSSGAMVESREVPTLLGLFDIIQAAIGHNGFQITVTYDFEFGYPSQVNIDYDENVTDEEFVAHASLSSDENPTTPPPLPPVRDFLSRAALAKLFARFLCSTVSNGWMRTGVG